MQNDPSSVLNASFIAPSTDQRVQQLLDQLADSHATPEEVCKSCPELLPVVRDRWLEMRRIGAELDVLFPPRDRTAPWPPSEEMALPHIPGYEIENVLGRGGMGIVYRARHVSLNRPVALKMLLAGAYAQARERGRFQLEAEAVARLQHPNVVQVYDFGEVDGRPYFTMELMDGASLAQRLTGTPQSAHPAAQMVATLAGAVHAAHTCGIVHRDLKPANVLVAADGTSKIADFGLARLMTGDAGLTETGVPVGTPSYMPPEQASGRKEAIGPAVDVYALGAILYELLTGRPPFRGETGPETIQQLITQDPVPPSRLNGRVPRDLETICLKCLRKEPERRYGSAQALGDDLNRFVEGRPIQARPVGWGERSWRWCRRNPAAAALLATALVLVGLASGGGVWLVQQRDRHDAELRSDVGTAVAQAESLRKGFHFSEARALLDLVSQRLEPAEPNDLRGQVDRALADLDLAEGLDAAGLQVVSNSVHGQNAVAGAERQYAAVFAGAGLGRVGDDAAATAARVIDSPLRTELVGALDDWASLAQDPARTWLLAVARRADPDPSRDRLRQPELWRNGAELTRLAREVRAAELSPQLAAALGLVLDRSGGDAVPLLRAAQIRFPTDFWLNYDLGRILNEAKRRDESIGYFRVALALRPELATPHFALGAVLQAKGQYDEASARYQDAVRLDPSWATAHYSLGGALHVKGQLDEAMAENLRAIELDPKMASAHHQLGMCWQAKGQFDEAMAEYRRAIEIDPKSPWSHYQLGSCWQAKGQFDEATAEYRRAIEVDPTYTLAPPAIASTLLEASRADVEAAAGQDSKAGHLSDSERADKRRQALARLRANLELRTKLLNEGKAVEWSVAAWQTDAALASVRDSASLEKLPDAERTEWQRLWAEVAAIVATDPLVQGRAFAERRDWVKAADAYARTLKRGPTDDGHFWFEYAALLLLAGDRPGYVKACGHMAEKCGKTGGPRSYHVARACTLASGAVADMALRERLAETELQASPRQFWSLTEQGALAYRGRRFQESVGLFEQSLEADATPGRAVVNWVWLALARQRLGQSVEARRWLVKAQAWLDQYREGMPADAEEKVGLHFHNWLEAHVLRQEAEALLR